MATIIRVPRHDEDTPSDSTVAINVLSSGPDLLDLLLIGTEGEHPYTLNCKPCDPFPISTILVPPESSQY